MTRKNMTRKEKFQISLVKREIAAGRKSEYISFFLSGLGVEVIDGVAWIGKTQIDLRFKNLTPEIKTYI